MPPRRPRRLLWRLPLKLHPLQKRHRPRRLRPASPAPPKRRLPPRQKLQKRGRQRPQHRQKSPQSLPVRLPQKDRRQGCRKAEPVKAEAPAEEKPAAENAQAQVRTRKKKETV